MDRDSRIENIYSHGECYPREIALHREPGLPIRCLTAKRFSARDPIPHAAHAWVETAEGKALDVTGIRDIADLRAEYLEGRPAFTLESAEVEAFGTEADFLARLKQIFNSDLDWPWYEGHLAKVVPQATEVVRNYVLPRHLQAEPSTELDTEPAF